MADLQHSPLDARAPCPRRAHGRVRRLGHAHPVHRRARGAPSLSRTMRWCSTCRTSAPSSAGGVARSTRCSGRSPTTCVASRPGTAQYTHLLDPNDASVVDDIIVWWVDDRTLLRHAQRVEHLACVRRARRSGRVRRRRGVRVRRRRRGRAPCSRCRGRSARAPAPRRCPRPPTSPGSRWRRLPGTARRSSSRAPGTPVRTGVEVHVDAARRRRLVGRDRRRPASRPRDWAHATPCGSKPACRCTATSSGRASRRCRRAWAGWCAGTRATSAAGAALDAERSRGRRACCGVSPSKGANRRAPAARSSSDGARVGEVTSGNFSPTLGHGIALAFLLPALEVGGAVEVDLRGRPVPATIVKPPFVSRDR